MAVKFDSTGDLLYLISGTPNKYPRTMLAWIRIDTDNNIDTTFMMRFGDAAGTVRQGFFVRTAATDLFIGVSGATGGGAYQLVSSATLGYWFPVAMTVDTNGSSLTLNGYVGSVGRDVTFHNTISSSDIADTSPSFSIGGTGADNSGASVAFCRVYNRVLTQDEIRAELASEVPVSTTSLYADYRFANGALTTDSSGNGHTLTANATPAFTDNPSIGAITMRNVPTMGANASGGTVTLPAGKVSGDFLHVLFGTDSGAVTWGGSGWSGNTRTHINNPDGGDLQDFYKFAGSSEANPTYTFPSNFGTSWAALAYDNVDTSNPFDVAYGEATDQNSNTGTVAVSVPSITTVSPNTKLIWVVATDQTASGVATFTPPAGFTLRGVANNQFSQVYVADMNQASAGATGAKAGSFTFTGGGGSGWIARMYALRPVSTGVNLYLTKTDAVDTFTSTVTAAIALGLTKTDANDTLSSGVTNAESLALTKTDANDTFASAATAAEVASLTKTDANDTLTATITSGILSLAITEQSDTLSTAATSAVAVASSTTDSSDTLASAGTTAEVATLSVTEAADTLSAASTLAIAINASTTDANDTLVSYIPDAVAINLTVTEQNDTLSSSATQAIEVQSTTIDQNDSIVAQVSNALGAAVFLTEQPDTLVSAATAASVVTLSTTDANDTLVSALTIASNLALSTQEASDTLSSAATNAEVVSSATTDANDTLLAVLSADSNPLVLVVQEQNDTLSATTTLAGVIALTKTDASDVLAAAATVAVALALATTDGADSLAATLSGPGEITANLNVLEQNDTLASTVNTTVALNATVQEASDILSALLLSVVSLYASVTEANDTLLATLRELGPEPAFPFVLRDDINAQIAIDLGLLAILADGRVVYII